MPPTPPSAAWLAYCRPGFEADLIEEAQALARRPARSVIAAPASGFVHVTGLKAPALAQLVFARQVLAAFPEAIALPGNDRVTPIAEAALAFLDANRIDSISDLWIEYPDTNEGKALSKLAQTLEPRVRARLGEARLGKGPRLHVLLTPQRTAFLGLADPAQASAWRNGIPRLRMPREAPSRSTLKLAEAFHTFLGEREERLLQPGMRAVDLGAAPGGWTWQLVHRGLTVTAVDNGRLKGELTDNALVRHLREDGFRYRPRQPVDWMVCDMVEKPVRIAALVAQWMAEGFTERCIFNLKLPMKKRAAEVARCRELILEGLSSQGRPHELAIRQLYHDREEVTGFCRHVPRSERRR